jgi:[acyl-carrier-protein] S-malonyltransferase
MGRALEAECAEARDVFDRVSQACGRDMRAICFEMEPPELRQTQNAQLALFTVGLAAAACFRAEIGEGAQPAAFAGHSVGEFTALAAAGAISVEAGARLVMRRGEIMAESGARRPGGMAAVIGLDAERLEAICGSQSMGAVVIANDNCPGQLVISGDMDAVQAATAEAHNAGARRVIPLDVSGAFHSPLMAESAQEFASELAQVEFQVPEAPVYSNVLAAPGEDWPDLLRRQLEGRVRWREESAAMIQAGIHRFVELGPGSVLAGLIRRVDRVAEVKSAGCPASLREAAQWVQQI